ncbi:hypothetical protein KKA14_02350 [bacterium]|nr:hypothetical protein [bacterium]
MPLNQKSARKSLFYIDLIDASKTFEGGVFRAVVLLSQSIEQMTGG